MNEIEEKMVKMMICAFENRPEDSLDSISLRSMHNDLLNCSGGDANSYDDAGISTAIPTPDPREYHLRTCANFKDLHPVGPTIFIYNFLFNRTKAYYSGLNFSSRPWYYEDPLAYQSINISDGNSKSKIFINPAKIYIGNSYKLKRYHISNFLAHCNGYRSRILVKNGQIFPKLFLEGMADHSVQRNWPSGYDPIHNRYYEDSFISIYAESTEKSPLVYITEKTYDPLIKGHFVLPFAASGIIKYLKLEGFRLPDFIDYSYDDIYDDDARYEVYIKEVERLVNLPMNTWMDHWNNNLDILKHNQSLFYTRDYDKIIDRLKNI